MKWKQKYYGWEVPKQTGWPENLATSKYLNQHKKNTPYTPQPSKTQYSEVNYFYGHD